MQEGLYMRQCRRPVQTSSKNSFSRCFCSKLQTARPLVALCCSLFITHLPSKGLEDFIANAALGWVFLAKIPALICFSLYFRLGQKFLNRRVALFKQRFRAASSSRTVACDHGFRSWQVDRQRSVHEAKVCPSVEHVEVDGHVQVQDLCDHRSYVCKGSEQTSV